MPRWIERLGLRRRAVLGIALPALAATASVMLTLPSGQPAARGRVHGGLASPLAHQRLLAAATRELRLSPAATHSYRPSPVAGGFTMRNARQRLAARMAIGEADVRSGGLRLGLRLIGYGDGKMLVRVPAVAPEAVAGQIVYPHPGLTEWWTNGPRALEQGFTIPVAPPGRASGRLVLALGLSGNVRGGLMPDGDGVMFRQRHQALLYRDLLATDARGRRLPAAVSLSGRRLELRINDHGARYPLRIDPSLQTTSAPDAYAQAVLADQPDAYYRLNETAGPTASDSSGSGQDATYESGVTFGTAGALVSDTGDSAITWPSGAGTALIASGSNFPAGNAARTVEFWWKTGNCNALPTLTYGNSGTNAGFEVGLAQCSTINGTSPGLNLLTGGQTFTWSLPAAWWDNRWHLFDVTYDGTTATGYMDGQLVGSSAVPTLLATAIPGNGFSISDGQNNGCCTGADSIDEVAIYPGALSPARIESHWTAGASHSGPCPAAPTDPYGQSVLANSPKMYLRLGDLVSDPANRVAYDFSGNCSSTDPVNGAYVTGATAQPNGAAAGYQGGAVTWPSGAGTAVTHSDNLLPGGNSERTVEFWWRTGNCNALPTVTYGGSGTNAAFDVGLAQCSTINGTSPGLNLMTGGASGQKFTWSLPAAWWDGKWHLFDVTYDGSTATGYMDGQVVGSSPVTTALSTATPGNGFTVSDDQNNGCCTGADDFNEVAVYPNALSPGQINSHWSAGGATEIRCPAAPTDPYGQAIVADSPLVYMRLGDLVSDPSDRVAHDFSGHCTASAPDNGAYVTGASAQPDSALLGYPGGAVTWPSGAGTAVSASGATLPSGNAARTVEFWWRTGNCNALPNLTYGGPGTNAKFEVGLANCSTINGTGQGLNLLTGAQRFTWPLPAAWWDAKWHLFDVTYDGTTAVGYMDGQVIGSSTVSALDTVVPGTGFTVTDDQNNGCCTGPDDIDEVAVYPTALSPARVNAHWKASFATPPGESVIAGTGTQSGGGGLQGVRAQACPTSGGPCTVDPYGSTSSGSFHMLVPNGTYTVTVFPPAGSPSGQVTIPNVTVPPSAANLSATFSPPGGLPSGVTLSSGSTGTQQNTVPRVNWGEPSTYSATGCPNGDGMLSLSGTNTSTGLPETVSTPMFETSPGSGSYQASIPPLAPMHGASSGNSVIDCPQKLGLFPSGGPPSGGTDVLLNAVSGLTGATAVRFGSNPASSFQVLTDSFIDATAPAGTGSVPVTVTASDGSTITIGTYTYLAVTSLSTGSGPASGGTQLTINGQGFQNGDQVLFGLVPAVSVSYVSPTQLQVQAPPNAGTVNVQVVQGNSVSAPSGSAVFVNQGGPPGTADLNQSTTSPQAYAKDVSEACQDTPLPETDPQLCGAARFSFDVFKTGYDELTHQAFKPVTEWLGRELGTVFAKGVADLTGKYALGAIAFNLIPVVGEIWDIYQGAKLLIDLGNDVCTLLTGGNCRWDFWNLFIDPSGTVVDTSGNPISGATTTLLAQPSGGGAFTTVDPSSGSIEPATNPETTGSSGAFHWDALAGTYKVEASKSGCHAPGDATQPNVFTDPVTIPPPAVGLLLTLDCGPSSPPVPTVSAVLPGGGPKGGGNIVDITGTGLIGASAVKFGNTPATNLEVLSPYAVAAVAPAGSGTVDITVAGPGGTSATGSADQYAYSTPPAGASSPAVTGVSPASGPLTGGTVVTITGTNLDGAYTVSFGGTAAARVTDVSSTEVQAVAPAAQFSGRVDISVTTSAGDSPAAAADIFTYGAPPPPPVPTLSVAAAPDPAKFHQPFTLTATVSPTDGGGAVAFYDGTVAAPIAGCGALPINVVAGKDQATCMTSTLAPGEHQIIATYSGDSSYASASATAPASVIGPPVSASPPSISGDTTAGQTLSEAHGTWSFSPTSFQYQWQRCDGAGNGCAPVSGASSATYTLTSGDVGHTFRVQESASNDVGDGNPATSAATGVVHPAGGSPSKPANNSPPVISGSPTAGRSLTASTGTWSGTPPLSYAYQWQLCNPRCSNIPGASASAYTPGTSAVGAQVRVMVTATNGVGTGSAYSSQVGPLQPNPAQVNTMLAALLSPGGKNAKIAALLRAGGYPFSFTAPSGGTLSLAWYYLPKGAHLARHKVARPKLVAAGTAGLTRAGPARIKLRLTAAGRAALAHATALDVISKVSYTPTGGAQVLKTRRFTLRR